MIFIIKEIAKIYGGRLKKPNERNQSKKSEILKLIIILYQIARASPNKKGK